MFGKFFSRESAAGLPKSLSSREAALFTQFDDGVQSAVAEYQSLLGQFQMADSQTFDDVRVAAAAEQKVIEALAGKGVALAGYPDSADSFSEFVYEFDLHRNETREAA